MKISFNFNTTKKQHTSKGTLLQSFHSNILASQASDKADNLPYGTKTDICGYNLETGVYRTNDHRIHNYHQPKQ